MLFVKTLLITGHNGFIGTHLVNSLNSTQYRLSGISNSLSDNSKIKQIKKDIRKINSSDIKKNSTIIHLASMSDVKSCNSNPEKCFEINVVATQKLLDIARKKDCKIIFASTSHVYGNPEKLPVSENHPTHATSIYAMSKIAGESLCESYSKTYLMDVTVLRFFSVYGPNSPSHLVTSNIISQFLNSDVIKLGNLQPKRDFIYVSDVIDSIHIAMKNLKKFQIFNVGSGNSHSIQEICDMLGKLTNSKKPIRSLKTNKRKVEVQNIISDTSNIRELGWKPTVSIKKGLELTLSQTN